MFRPHERILLIGDSQREMQAALTQALPAAHVTPVGSVFDGIAELTANPYSAVLACVEPIERRPEAAVKTLRQLAGDSRLLLFGQPSLEPLSRKMLEFGCDDYVLTPPNPAELQQIFGTPPVRLATTPSDASADAVEESLVTEPPSRVSLLAGLPLAEVLLESLLQHPTDSTAAAVKRINQLISPTMQLMQSSAGDDGPEASDGMLRLSHAVRVASEELSTLHLLIPRDEDEAAARHFLSQLAHLVGKVSSLEDRHNRLQKLAITDELTGLYNGRYFKHFLTKIIERARTMRFPVTLLLFDIDNFKKYNDQFGHGVGDEILKQTAALMRRCVRDHDLVARISGDEFAVVFWEKDGPRQAHHPSPSTVPGRPPQAPRQVFERFQKLLATQDFSGLGPSGLGTLTISGGLAVFPYDAANAQDLITAADNALMFGAKQQGKNSIYLVGGEPGDQNPG